MDEEPVLKTGRSVMSRFRGSIPLASAKIKRKTMANIEKKRRKINERIELLEEELRTALTKKTSDVKEIDVAGHTRKIQELREQLAKLK